MAEFDIDPVEFGEMRQDIKHTRSDVKYIREKLEPRVRKVELKQAAMWAAMLVVGTIATLVAKFIL